MDKSDETPHSRLSLAWMIQLQILKWTQGQNLEAEMEKQRRHNSATEQMTDSRMFPGERSKFRKYCVGSFQMSQGK